MIVSVIVTYNRRDKVCTAVTAILTGSVLPDKIVIVNNSSDSETRAILQKLADANQMIEIFHTKKNFGGSGGFAIGIKIAYDMGADYIWINDDDAYVDYTCLEKLLRAKDNINSSQKEFSFLCSKVNWRDGNVCQMNVPVLSSNWMLAMDIHPRLLGVATCSFVSCLINSKYLAITGLPIMEFFIWYDDVEFTSRLSSLAPGYLVLDSTILHDMENNLGVDYLFLNNCNLWKYRFGARNHAWTILHKKGFLRWLRFSIAILRDKRLVKINYKLKFSVVIAGLSAIFLHCKILAVNELDVGKFLE